MYLADLPAELLERAAAIRLVAFDVDGTLTDGRLPFGAAGQDLKHFHVHDGLGLKQLQRCGIEVAIITARSSEAVSRRMAELGIGHVYQGVADKRACLGQLLAQLQLQPVQAAFVGDDLPDLAPMRTVGLAIAVANAHPWLAREAHWQTRQCGGHGAAREVSDLLVLAQGRQDEVVQSWY
ncbi:KdsC family phosphatase [Frateuria aurantia]